MAKTKREIATRALRRIGVVAHDEAATADQYAVAEDALVSLYAELNASNGFSMTFGPDAVPDDYFLPMAYLLAVEIAPDFTRPAPDRRNTALLRLRGADHVYVRDMDFNEDGVTTQDEIDTFDRGAYF